MHPSLVYTFLQEQGQWLDDEASRLFEMVYIDYVIALVTIVIVEAGWLGIDSFSMYCNREQDRCSEKLRPNLQIH